MFKRSIVRLVFCALLSLFVTQAVAQMEIINEVYALTSEFQAAQQRGDDLTPYFRQMENLIRQLQADPNLPPDVKAMLAESLQALQQAGNTPDNSQDRGPGYYAYQQTATPQDQDQNLSGHAGGRFYRIGGSGAGKTFSDLCFAVDPSGQLGCAYVLDWEGKRHDCGNSADDGSRVAWCGGGSPAAKPDFSEQRRAANQAAANELRNNAATISFSVGADNSECTATGALLGVSLQIEGPIVEEQNGITQYVTGAWFGDHLPYVEGFGGLQIPSGDARSAMGQWHQFDCRNKTFVVTFDTRRHPGGPPVEFHWSGMFQDASRNHRGIKTIRVQNGMTYSYKGSGS